MGTRALSPSFYCPSNGSPASKLMVTATFLAQWASWSINAQKGFGHTLALFLHSFPSHPLPPIPLSPTLSVPMVTPLQGGGGAWE